MISGWQLLVILVIVLLLFGTKKIRNLGSDLGDAIKNFRNAVKDGEDPNAIKEQDRLPQKEGNVIEAEVEKSDKKNV